MNNFTPEEKKQIDILAYKAEDLFFKYLKTCEQIETLLNNKNPDEEENLHEVLYQMGDGICVAYSDNDSNVDNNIPIARYIKGDRV